MRVIVGLGNPEEKYQKTRHNVGFMVVDALNEKYHGEFIKECDALISRIVINGEEIMLVKPQSGMNNSGSVFEWLKGDYIVIVDDIHLDFGRIKVRKHGSSGGHNGLKDIIRVIGVNFTRIRIGIGMPDGDLLDWVLGEFEEDVTVPGIEVIEYVLKYGVGPAMNKFNARSEI